MNTLEILLARDLLISAPGMVALNLCFLGVVWYWALHPPTAGQK
jgi:cbb3-type cytochrome oxidase subunit 3